MKMLKHQGGCSIAVYNPKKRRTRNRPSAKDIAFELLEQKRADYALPTDYSEDSPLDLLMKAFIDRVAASARMGQTKRAKRPDEAATDDDNDTDVSKDSADELDSKQSNSDDSEETAK